MIVTVYWILFLLGLGFAIVSAIMAGLTDFGGHAGDLGGHDLDMGAHTLDMGSAHMDAGAHGDLGDIFHGQGEIAFSPVSPMTIFAFVGGFGGGGLIGSMLGLTSWGTLLTAIPTGFGLSFGIYYIMYAINKTNVSSEARASELIGISAEIITPIFEDGTGEIAYVSRGSRYNSPAKSLDGKSIAKGKPVRIVRVVGSTCYVKEISPDEVEHPAKDPADV